MRARIGWKLGLILVAMFGAGCGAGYDAGVDEQSFAAESGNAGQVAAEDVLPSGPETYGVGIGPGCEKRCYRSADACFTRCGDDLDCSLACEDRQILCLDRCGLPEREPMNPWQAIVPEAPAADSLTGANEAYGVSGSSGRCAGRCRATRNQCTASLDECESAEFHCLKGCGATIL